MTLAFGFISIMVRLIDVCYLRPLPFPASSRLVVVEKERIANKQEHETISGDDYSEWRTHLRAFDQAALFRQMINIVRLPSGPRPVASGEASAELWEILAVKPACGRLLSADDSTPAHDQVAMISAHLWRSEFMGDCGVVGRMIAVSGRPFQIVGVLPDSFSFFKFYFGNDLDILTPVALIPNVMLRSNNVFTLLAHLREGGSVRSLNEELRVSAASLGVAYVREWRGWTARAWSLRDRVNVELRALLPVLLVACLAVLCVAAFNLSSLLTASYLSRFSESAVLTALGAPPSLGWQQLVVESSIFLVCGCICGLTCAVFATRYLIPLLPVNAYMREQLNNPSFEPLSAVLMVSLLLVSLLLSTAAPALSLSADREQLLRFAGSSIVGGGIAHRIYPLLASVQVAVTFILVLVAILMVRSYRSVELFSLGYKYGDIISLRVQLPHARYDDAVEQEQFVQRVTAGLSNLPFVRDVATSERLETEPAPDFPVRLLKDKSADAIHMAHVQIVSGNYFRTLNIPVMEGSDPGLDHRTKNQGAPAVVANRALERLLGAGDVAGLQIVLPEFGSDQHTIIAVVADTHASAYIPPEPTVYMIGPDSMFFFLIRSGSLSASSLTAISRVIREMEPEAALDTPKLFANAVDHNHLAVRLRAFVLALLAFVAMGLAFVGVQGAILETVALKQREFAVRVSLGASPASIAQLILSRAARFAFAGIVVGVAGFIVVSRFLASSIYGVGLLDPINWVAGMSLVLGATFVACLPGVAHVLHHDNIAIMRVS